MPKMTGGQALAKSLYREGVRVIFGLPGVQLYHMMDGLYDEPGIRFINTRHEQATTYMADGYARAGGGIGTALVVPGPGLQNASAGIGTAYAASSPVLVVAGQIQKELIGVDRGMLHEINDQIDTIKPVTKWAHRIMDAAEVPEAVHEAFHQLQIGRPRPVEIEIPPETLEQVADVDLLEPGIYERPAADSARIREAAQMISQASNPLIFVGGGAVSSDATEALVKVAEFLQAPVITTAEGKGAISDRHYLSIGSVRFRSDVMAAQMEEHDIVLAVGTRLASPDMLKQKVIQIDIDEEEIGRNYSDTYGLVGDAGRTLDEIHKIISATSSPRDSRREEIESLRAQIDDSSPTVEPQNSLTQALRNAIPDDGVVISGMTQIGYYSRNNFPVYEPRTYLTSSYYGNLGYAYPTALGAKVAQPDKAVVAISGDGGFLFNSQELSTAVKHEINAVVVVFNDNAYGNVLRDQVTRFNGRSIGAELHNPDFVKLAEAYGARGVRAEGADALEAAVKEALKIEAPSLIEVPVGMMPSPFG
ncbi:MAG TPA: thiamine pyrophosphate-binding protein [Dehalococcoidia bacterium]|nr:thiamine pyrophosphate-binding protein [Dehalococcoidia bacterium]HIM18491.1 thiamine pyrophosphate-binding protein [Dehalococcoidia bacterium]|tara:strand:- start:125 stop:1723 length:1599 start_codon:yes stop_codon:yes gene_type:complete